MIQEIKDYVSFDLEFNTVDDVKHLLQVSAVKYINHQEVDYFDSYVHTKIPIKSFISGLTGITVDKIKTAPSTEEVLIHFKEFVGELPLIGYSGRSSDIPVLKSHGLDMQTQYEVDVYEIATALKSTYLAGAKGLSLKSVAEYLKLQGRAHNSLEDARMTAQVYQGLLNLKSNEVYLDEQEVVSNNPFAGLLLDKLFNEE